MNAANGRTNANLLATLGVTAVVSLTVFLALFLAQADSRQGRLAAHGDGDALPTIRFNTPTSGPVVTAVTIIITLPPASPVPSENEAELATATAVAEDAATAVACGRIPPGWVAYRVRFGDTLMILARQTGATVAEIMTANCLSDTVIYSGTRLYLPILPPTPCPGPPESWVSYTVQPGDTLFSLATARGVTVRAVMNANCRAEERITVGQQIFLPPLPATATATAVTPTATPTIPPVATATFTPSPEPTAPTEEPPTSTLTPEPETPTATLTATAVTPTATATPTESPPEEP
jgi:LysM repeat protein